MRLFEPCTYIELGGAPFGGNGAAFFPPQQQRLLFPKWSGYWERSRQNGLIDGSVSQSDLLQLLIPIAHSARKTCGAVCTH